MLRSIVGANEFRQVFNYEILHGLKVTSISNLRTKSINALQEDASNGKSLATPRVPSFESIWLQFLPNNTVAVAAEKMTDSLGVKRGLQQRMIRKQHVDYHFVNAMTRHHKDWCVGVFKLLSGTENCSILFVGQDDKAKNPYR